MVLLVGKNQLGGGGEVVRPGISRALKTKEHREATVKMR
jgi:hypothetical protein